MNGSGMLIINPPWKFDQEMNEIMPWLWKTLSHSQQGGFRVNSLQSKTP
jgi:23S rRNA (adenine2030-N6)-methyltransferase